MPDYTCRAMLVASREAYSVCHSQALWCSTKIAQNLDLKNRKEPSLLDLIQPYVIFAPAFHAGVKRQKIIFPSNFFHSALAKEQNMQQLMWSHISLWPDRFPLSWSCRPHKPDKGDKVRRKSMWTEGQRNAWIFSGKPSMCKRVGMHM